MKHQSGGWGGRRVGAGRKPRTLRVVAPYEPAAPKPPTTNPDAGGGVPVVADFNAPDDLSPSERGVWLKLAPHALSRQTLTKATALGFEMLCRNIVLERILAMDMDARGGPNHRGLIASIDRELLRFDLSPNGRPHGDAESQQPKKSKLQELQDRRAALKVVP